MTDDRSAAIAGLGISDVGRVYKSSAVDFAIEAVTRAVADAGLALSDIDGLLTSGGIAGTAVSHVARALGLRDLSLEVNVNAFGATAGAAVQYAAMAVTSGMAQTVVYVHLDAPLRAPGESSSDTYRALSASRRPTGYGTITAAAGITGANPLYALAARRHMDRYGTTTEQLGAVAVAERAWAVDNPLAQMRDPITLEDHQNSRWIAEPLRLLDCCLVSNGAVAVLVTDATRAQDLAQPPAYLWGWGQGHPGIPMERGSEWGLRTGAAISGPIAFRMAGIELADVDVCELYDCYTYTVLVTLEDYGFCEKGEGGPFVAEGLLGPGGSLPTNTGGGQLSSFYLWGATPLSEGVIQARGQGSARQAPKHDIVLVSGNGGILDYHATLLLGAHPRP